MGSRLDLHAILLTHADNVYFQPPEGFKMVYPCILYAIDRRTTSFANNNPYIHKIRYQITVIDKNPESTIPGTIKQLPTCIFSTRFVSDNLNHDVFSMYF